MLSKTNCCVGWQGRTKLDKLCDALVVRVDCLLEQLTIQRKCDITANATTLCYMLSEDNAPGYK
jgi:hypothetical protein